MNFLIRHPHPFEEIRQVAHDCWLKPDAVTQQEYEKLKQPEDPPTFEEWVLLQGDHLSDRIRVRLIQAIMDNVSLGTKLNALQWDVLDLRKSRFQFLTSDWPLYREINNERRLFALPISPTALFVAVSHRDILRKMKSDKPDAMVRKINIEVVSAARLYVYGCDNSQENFVRKRMSTKIPKPFFPNLQGMQLQQDGHQ